MLEPLHLLHFNERDVLVRVDADGNVTVGVFGAPYSDNMSAPFGVYILGPELSGVHHDQAPADWMAAKTAAAANRTAGAVNDTMEQRRAWADLKRFSEAVNTYLSMCRSAGIPNRIDTLHRLITGPPEWPYTWFPLVDDPVIPVDPWGNPYGLHEVDVVGDMFIVSLGRDGKRGGDGEDADLVYPQRHAGDWAKPATTDGGGADE
jgi:hypothetical protein